MIRKRGLLIALVFFGGMLLWEMDKNANQISAKESTQNSIKDENSTIETTSSGEVESMKDLTVMDSTESQNEDIEESDVETVPTTVPTVEESEEMTEESVSIEEAASSEEDEENAVDTSTSSENTISSSSQASKQSTEESTSISKTNASSADEATASVQLSSPTDLTENLPGIAETVEVEENYQFSVAKNQTTGEFIQSISGYAQDIAWKSDLYASVMISQAILETGSGGSSLSQAPNYNLFGVKGSYKGSAVTFSTQEDEGNGTLYTITASFRKYPSYKESLEDYAELLKNGITGNPTYYSKTWKENTDSYKDVTAFLTGRYATDTNYGSKLNALIEAYDLTKYDQKSDTKVTTKSVQATTKVALEAITTVENGWFRQDGTEIDLVSFPDAATYVITSLNSAKNQLSVFRSPAKEIMGSQMISSAVEE